MRIFLFLFIFLASPALAFDAEGLADRIQRAGNLAPLFETLDTKALAAEAGGDTRLAAALAAVRDKLQSDGITGAAFAPKAAGQTLRLNFTNGSINYLTLAETDGGALAGWYDYALGVHLHELVTALAGLDAGQAGEFLKRLGRAPGQLMDQVPTNDPRARLVLAACAGLPCYTAVLSRQQPMEPVRASLWRYEQAVLLERRETARQAMAGLGNELGEDPGLAWLQAATLMGEGDYHGALARAEKGLERAPDYRPLYGLAAQSAVMAEQYDRATRWFRRLEEKFGQRIDWQAMQRQARWRDYLESDSFRKWQDE